MDISKQLNYQNIANIRDHLRCKVDPNDPFLLEVLGTLGISDCSRNVYDYDFEAIKVLYATNPTKPTKPIKTLEEFFIGHNLPEKVRITNYYNMKHLVAHEAVVLSCIQDGNRYTVTISAKKTEKIVQIESRLAELTTTDIETIAKFICNQYASSPETQFSAIMQIDTHCTRTGDNSPWIGMSLAMPDGRAIPVQIVSADIGCGLSVFPLVIDGKHAHMDIQSLWHLQHAFMLSARKHLSRGRQADEGKAIIPMSLFFQQCDLFLSDSDGIMPLKEFSIKFTNFMKLLNFTYPISGTDEESALKYLFGFLCSLGSSGNHFCELGYSTTSGEMYTVVHSGSRGIGSKIFEAIDFMCQYSSCGGSLATGKLAVLYTQAYELLEQIAFYNRFMCVLAIYNGLKPTYPGIAVSSQEIKLALVQSQMLKEAREEVRPNLIKGMIHNGLSAFVDHQNKRALVVVKKGSIAMSRGCGIGFVALSAGIGCVSFIRNQPDVTYIETTLQTALNCINQGYTIDTMTSTTDIETYGHGAGRTQSTSKSAKETSMAQIDAHARDNNYISNRGCGAYGDGPISYRNPNLEIYGSNCTIIKTLVSFKECIVPQYEKSLFDKFAVDALSVYDKYISSNDDPVMQSSILCLDLILLKSRFQYKKQKTQEEQIDYDKYVQLCKLQTQLIIDIYGKSYVNDVVTDF